MSALAEYVSDLRARLRCLRVGHCPKSIATAPMEGEWVAECRRCGGTLVQRRRPKRASICT